MKCDRCFYCTHIGAGVMEEYPMKFCKRTKRYKMPFIVEYEKGKPRTRQLDLSDMKDCRIWAESGCNIHPNTVKKAKNDYIRKFEEEIKRNDANT